MHYIAPWWIIAFISLGSAFFLTPKSSTSTMFGFLAGFLLWAGVAFFLDVENQHILSTKIGLLFGGLGSTILVSITGLIGGILAMLGSYIGSNLRTVVDQKK